MIARDTRPRRPRRPLRPFRKLTDVLRAYAAYHGNAASTIEQKTVAINMLRRFLNRPKVRARLQAEGPIEPTTRHLRRKLILAFLRWYGKQVQPATVANKRKDLVALWGYAYDEGMLRRPAYRIKRPRVPEKVPEGWNEEELRRILAACDTLPISKFDRTRGRLGNGVPLGKYFRAFALCYLATGLRLSAMLMVRRVDVRTDLTFTARWQTQKTWCEEQKQLTPEAWAAIKSLGDHEFCLPYGQTKNQRRKVIWPTWKRILRAAGLDDSRGTGPQQLRRTAASFKEKQQPGSGEKFLNHKTPGLARRRYFVPRIVQQNVVAPPTLNLGPG